MAPMLKSGTATMLKRSRSYSSPKTSSSHFIAALREYIACPVLGKSSGGVQILRETLRPDRVTNVSSLLSSFPATKANKYDGFLKGSSQTAKCLPPSRSP
uniref:Uncharacterized protein n=1 Tax=Opuntia streptacantha TaxID=393608 RepID=A0A7C9ATJ5_OPUST